MLERIAEDMELSLNRPDKDMVAYQQPVPAAPEEKAKIRVVEQEVTTEIPEQLMKSQASQLDGEGAAKDSATETLLLVAVSPGTPLHVCFKRHKGRIFPGHLHKV